MHAYFFPVLFGIILTVRSDTRPKAAKTAFYAVAAGRKPGIYRTWPEAESQVRGFGGAKYKKFNTESEARSFVGTGAPGPNGSSKPYQRPGTNASDRATSPISYAESSDLPPDLKDIAKDGFRFSSGQPPRLVAYTDGSGLGNGKRGARAGAGVYWGDGKAALHNIAERVPGKEQTNNRGELLSIIRAIEMCPHPQLPLEIRTDSQYSISCMTVYLPKWVSNGWKTTTGDVKNSDMIKHLLVLLRRRKASVRFKHVKGHAGHEGNEAADQLARAGAVKEVWERTDWLDPDVDDAAVETKAEVEVDIDDGWLMTDAEILELEKVLE